MRTPFPARRFSIDDGDPEPGIVWGADLIEDNDLSETELVDLGALAVGESYVFGGGAAAEITVTRLPDLVWDETVEAHR